MRASTGVVGEKQSGIGGFFYYFLLIGGAVLSLYPFYWMFVIATNSREKAFAIPPEFRIGNLLMDNFDRALANIQFFNALKNSAFVASLTTASVLFFCTLAGFAFAKYAFRGKTVLFVIVLGTLLVPQQLSVLPNYVIMAKLEWINSFKAIIIPGMVNAFGIFWMRQYISSAVHNELIEAARVDGCGHFKIFYRIVLPIVIPALATLGIFTFLNVWNDFFWPLVILKSADKYTIQLALTQLFTIRDGLDYGKIMAATFFATLPLLITFLLFSRWFISGLTSGAVKS